MGRRRRRGRRRRVLSIFAAISALAMLVALSGYIRAKNVRSLGSASRSQTDAWYLTAHSGNLHLTHQKLTPAAQQGWTIRNMQLGYSRVFDATGAADSFMMMAPEDVTYTRSAWWISRIEFQMGCQPSALPAAFFMTVTTVGAPFWMIAVVFAVAPAVWFFTRSRADMWARTGRCVNCGYDLRATPGRCPECGAIPDAPINA